MEKIKGRVWIFGDNVDTDQILPGYAMAEDFDNLGKFAMCGSDIEDFAQKISKGDIIVAGKNFGCGSSREQAPVALQKAGVGAVVAQSFARIFRRNSINIGLLVLPSDLVNHVQNGDEVEIDVDSSTITVNGKTIEMAPLSKSVYDTIEAGGLINRVRKELQQEGKL